VPSLGLGGAPERRVVRLRADAVLESYIAGSNRLLVFINQAEAGAFRQVYPAKRGLVELYEEQALERGGGGLYACRCVREAVAGSRYLLALSDLGRAFKERPTVTLFAADTPHYVVAINLLMARLAAETLRGRMEPVILAASPGEALAGRGGAELARLAMKGLEGEILHAPLEGEGGESGVCSEAYRIAELMGGGQALLYRCGLEATVNYLKNLVFEEHGTLPSVIFRGALALAWALRLTGFPFGGGNEREYVYVGALTYYYLVRAYLESLLLGAKGLLPEGSGAWNAFESLLEAYERVARGRPRGVARVGVIQVRRLDYLYDALAILARLDAERRGGLEEAAESFLGLARHFYILKCGGGGCSVTLEPLRRHAEALREYEGLLKDSLKAVAGQGSGFKPGHCDTLIAGISQPLDILVAYRLLRAVLERGRLLGVEVELPATGVERKLRFSRSECAKSLAAIAERGFLEALAGELEREAEEWERVEAEGVSVSS
jgi:hypothetical protein